MRKVADVLEGGDGFMARAHGLAIDSLVAMDVVLANGSLVHSTSTAYSDVFFVRIRRDPNLFPVFVWG